MVQLGLKTTLYGIWTRYLQLTASFFPKTKMKHPFFFGSSVVLSYDISLVSWVLLDILCCLSVLSGPLR